MGPRNLLRSRGGAVGERLVALARFARRGGCLLHCETPGSRGAPPDIRRRPPPRVRPVLGQLGPSDPRHPAPRLAIDHVPDLEVKLPGGMDLGPAGAVHGPRLVRLPPELAGPLARRAQAAAVTLPVLSLALRNALHPRLACSAAGVGGGVPPWSKKRTPPDGGVGWWRRRESKLAVGERLTARRGATFDGNAFTGGRSPWGRASLAAGPRP